MGRLLKGIVITAFFLSLSYMSGYSQLQISIPDTVIQPGRNLRVPVTVTDITSYKFYSFGLQVQYDSSLVEGIRAFAGGTLSSGGIMADNILQGNIIKVGAGNTTTYSGKGVLIYLYFQIKQKASGISRLQFKEFFFDRGDTQVSTKDGKVIVNTPPKIISKPIKKAFVDSLYTYQVRAEDIDGDTLIYKLLQAPQGMRIDSISGLITWTPTVNSPKTNKVEVRVQDKYYSDTQSFTIVVSKNRPKQFVKSFSGTDTTRASFSFEDRGSAVVNFNHGVTSGKSISFSFYDTIPPPEVIDKTPSFKAVAFFTIESILDSGSFEAEVRYQFTEKQLKEKNIDLKTDLRFAVLDSAGGQWKIINTTVDTVSNSVLAVISNFYSAWAIVDRPNFLGINRPPRIWGEPVKKASADSLYTARIFASDPDNDALIFRLLVKPLLMTINSTTGVLSWTPSSADTGLHKITVEIYDSKTSSTMQFPLVVFSLPPKNTVKKLQNDTAKVEIQMTGQQEKMEIKFNAGTNIQDKNVEVTLFDQTPPAEVRTIPIPPKKVLFFEVKTDIPQETFSAVLRVPFTNEQLQRANIKNKKKVTFARFTESDSTWIKVPTEIDTVNNIAEALVDHFSIWTLIDEEYFGVTGISDDKQENKNNIPDSYKLYDNFPNPFNPVTAIQFEIPKSLFVTLSIYNILGQTVRVLVKESKPAGFYTVVWDGKNEQGIYVSSGIYLYQLRTEKFTSTKKMLLLK